MPIFKTNLLITFLMEADTQAEAEVYATTHSPAAIIAEMDSGDLLGTSAHVDTVEIPADQLQAEQEAMGSDGTFFPTDDD